MTKLYAHQVEGIDAFLSNCGGFMISCEQGTGKTPMAIRAADRMNIEKVLVVCPNTLKRNWDDEWGVWGEFDWKRLVVRGTKLQKKITVTQAGLVSGKVVLIINYDILKSMLGELKQFEPDLIIADESHLGKNHKAQRTKALKAIPCKYKLAMTGTPTPNNPLDIWSQFDWIRPGHLSGNFYAFRNHFANMYSGAGFTKIVSYKNLDRLAQLVGKYTYRKTKDECLDLPEKVYQTIPIELDDKTKAAYVSMARDMIADVEEAGEMSASTALVKLLRLQQITSGFIKVDDTGVLKDIGGEKLRALEDLIENLHGEKLVIWCRFNNDVKRIGELLDRLKIAWKPLIGAVPEAERQNSINAFQSTEYPLVIVSNVAVGGVGITLTAARYAIYYSRTFSYGEAKQSEDRIHRIGQDRKVTYYDLACSGTIDYYILKILQQKADLSSVITGDTIREVVYGDLSLSK